MAPYRIDLHDQDDAVTAQHHGMFEHDDAAIDHAGRLGHPHSMRVWQGDRLVAHFQPVRQGQSLR